MSIESKYKFTLGTKVQENISKISGSITGRAEFLTSEKRYEVTPDTSQPGMFPEPSWFDESRLTALQ
jgi:hypothetical protein